MKTRKWLANDKINSSLTVFCPANVYKNFPEKADKQTRASALFSAGLTLWRHGANNATTTL